MDLDASGMNIAYLPEMPPVVDLEGHLPCGDEFTVDIPKARSRCHRAGSDRAHRRPLPIPDLRVDPQQGDIVFKAAGSPPPCSSCSTTSRSATFRVSA